MELLQLYGDQVVPGQPKKRVCKHVLGIFTTYMETSLKNCKGVRLPNVGKSQDSLIFTIFGTSGNQT